MRSETDAGTATPFRPYSTKQLVRLDIEGTARWYDLRPLSYRERLAMDGVVGAKWGKLVAPGRLRAVLVEAIRAVYDGQEQTDALATLTIADELLATWRAARAEVSPGSNGDVPEHVRELDRQLIASYDRVARIQEETSWSHPPLARLLAAQDMQRGEYIAERVALGVVAWSLPQPCEHRGGRLTDDAMNAIPDDDLVVIAEKVAALAKLTEDAVGESVSPSGAPDTATSLPH